MQQPDVRPARPPRRRAVVVLALVLAAGIGSTASWGTYRIRPGDTLWGLARVTHTTVRSLQLINGLHSTLIYAGQLLELPGAGTATPLPGTVGATATGGRGVSTYQVHPSDTLSSIARRTGVPVRTLAARNGLRAPYTIYVGRRLVIARTTVSGGQPQERVGGSIGAAIGRHSAELAASRQPTRSQVRSMIRAEAARRGVDPALALGIADVESGFDQRAVSRTDAVGVMQLMPATASWLGTVVGRPLNRLQAADNIAGGIALLHTLLAQTTLRNAVAGYYQGLGSVRRQGMFADTRHYVATVLAVRNHFR